MVDENLVDLHRQFSDRYGYELSLENEGENRWCATDSGDDGRGVDVVGTPRHNWFKKAAADHGLLHVEGCLFRFETIDTPEAPAPAQEEEAEPATDLELTPYTVAPPLEDIETEHNESIDADENERLYKDVQEEQ